VGTFCGSTRGRRFSLDTGGLVGDWRRAGRRVVGGGLRPAAENRNSSGAEDIFDDCFFETGGVVIEVEQVGIFVEAKFLNAVGIGELSEGSILLGRERSLQFVGDGHVGHGGIIAGCFLELRAEAVGVLGARSVENLPIYMRRAEWNARRG